MERIALYNDSFPKLENSRYKKGTAINWILPYQLGRNAYGSNPMWYKDGDNANGESEYAGKTFFDTDSFAGFRIPPGILSFCSNLLIKEPKETGKAPCMFLFCAFEQQFELIEEAKKVGFNHYINIILIFQKNFSPRRY